MNIADVAYMAGIIDGEGCISIIKQNATSKRYKQYTTRLSIVSTDKDFIEHLHSIWGGYIQKRSNGEVWKDSYVLVQNIKKTTKTLRACLPYLLIKKRQALLALSLVEQIQKYPNTGRAKMDEQEEKSREELFIQMKLLNKKGK